LGLYFEVFDGSRHGRDGFIGVSRVENLEKVVAFNTGAVTFCKAFFDFSNNNFGDKITVCPDTDVSVVSVWNLNTKEKIMSFNPAEHERNLGMCMGVTINEVDGISYLTTCYEDGGIYVWDVRQNAILFGEKLQDDPVICMTFNKDITQGVCGGASNLINFFTISFKESILTKTKEIKLTNKGINDLKIRQDQKILASGGWDSKIRIFSWKSKKQKAILNFHSQSISTLAFPSTNNPLIAGSKDNRITSWNIY